MNKVIASLLMIGVVAAMAGAGTFAYFTDSETSSENTFTAGTLDLTVDGAEGPLEVKVALDCMAPGDEDEVGPIVLANVGCIDGIADLHYNVTDDPTGLATQIIVDVWYDADQDGVEDDGEVLFTYADGVTLDDLDCIGFDLGPLPAGGAADLYLSFHFDEAAQDEYQGATCTFDIEFTLHQEEPPV